MHRRPGGLVGVQVSTDKQDELLELQQSHENLKKSDTSFEDEIRRSKREFKFSEMCSSLIIVPQNSDESSESSNESSPTTVTLGKDIPRRKKQGASVTFHPALNKDAEIDDDGDDENEDDDELTSDNDNDYDGIIEHRDHAADSTDDSGLGIETKRRMSKDRRPSQASKLRRPSYTCYHGPPLPRGTPKIGKRSKAIKRIRDRDLLQLAAGTVVMLSPLTPEILRYKRQMSS